MIGHEKSIASLRAALASGRLHPALLFEGPEGVGKKLVALTLARAMHCPDAPSRDGDPCGACRTCLAIAASADPSCTADNESAHPGVRVVTPSRPDERELRFGGTAARGDVRSQIAVSQIRVVIAEGAIRGMGRGRRVVIVDPADRMNESAANALLKTLEEPPAGEHFVLLTARPSALLPTIRSRCVRFRFGPLSREALRAALGAAHRTSDDLILLGSLAGGRVGRALALLEGPALRTFRATRGVLLDTLELLDRGLPSGTFAVLGAASVGARDRDQWLEAIGVLELLLRDLAVLAVDPAGEAVNLDLRERLARMALRLGKGAARALPVLDSVRSDFRVNVNARLAFERILLEVARF